MVNLFWVYYGISAEEMYDLAIWRMLRQVSAINRWKADEIRDRTLAHRAAQAQDSDYRRFIGSLGTGKRGKMPMIRGPEAKRFGLLYQKEK